MLFPFPDQESFFSSCDSKHPEKSARRQTEQPGAHHCFPPWTSLPHQGGHLCLSSGDPRLSKRGVACQEATGKPHSDHHQHRQKTQPKYWGSSLFSLCWHHRLTVINHQYHLSTIEMSHYGLSLNEYNVLPQRKTAQLFNCSFMPKSRRKFYSKSIQCLFCDSRENCLTLCQTLCLGAHFNLNLQDSFHVIIKKSKWTLKSSFIGI